MCVCVRVLVCVVECLRALPWLDPSLVYSGVYSSIFSGIFRGTHRDSKVTRSTSHACVVFSSRRLVRNLFNVPLAVWQCLLVLQCFIHRFCEDLNGSYVYSMHWFLLFVLFSAERNIGIFIE